MRILTFLFSLLLPMALVAETNAPPTPAQAYQTVLNAEQFSIGPVGYAGSTSATERAFEVVLQESDAAQQFGKILSNGTPAGQLYALLGLKKSDKTAYKMALEKLKGSEAKVRQTSGCKVGETTVSAVAAKMDTWE